MGYAFLFLLLPAEEEGNQGMVTIENDAYRVKANVFCNLALPHRCFLAFQLSEYNKQTGVVNIGTVDILRLIRDYISDSFKSTPLDRPLRGADILRIVTPFVFRDCSPRSKSTTFPAGAVTTQSKPLKLAMGILSVAEIPNGATNLVASERRSASGAN